VLAAKAADRVSERAGRPGERTSDRGGGHALGFPVVPVLLTPGRRKRVLKASRRPAGRPNTGTGTAPGCRGRVRLYVPALTSAYPVVPQCKQGSTLVAVPGMRYFVPTFALASVLQRLRLSFLPARSRQARRRPRSAHRTKGFAWR